MASITSSSVGIGAGSAQPEQESKVDKCKNPSRKPHFIKHETVVYITEEDKIQKIESLMERVSDIYANFLRKDWHDTRPDYIPFMHPLGDSKWKPQKFPSTTKVEQFKENLKNAMIKELNGDEEDLGFSLSVAEEPEDLLSKILNDSHLDLTEREFHIFPFNTRLWVRLCRPDKIITIKSNF